MKLRIYEISKKNNRRKRRNKFNETNIYLRKREKRQIVENIFIYFKYILKQFL